MSAATAAVQAAESKTVMLETNQSFQMDKLEVSQNLLEEGKGSLDLSGLVQKGGPFRSFF